jgi:hypothetical protein
MRKLSLILALISILLLLPFGLAGCDSVDSGATVAIESYLKALEDKDLNQMINLSCTEWESQAKLEYDSFAAVDVTLEEVHCQENGGQNEYTLVSCTGRIIASYGAEDLVIELSERGIKAVQQGGEWRMCGYQ